MRVLQITAGLILLLATRTLAQPVEKVVVEKKSPLDGLSSYNIRKVLKDQFGFIWVATQDGLNRYDGRSFRVYSKTYPDERRRLVGADIRDMFEDTTNKTIWVLPGEGGLDKIDLVSGNITHAYLSPNLGVEDWNICMTKAGDKIWIGSYSGLKIFDIKSGKFEKVKIDTSSKYTVNDFEIRCIFNDGNGNVWVCCAGYGVCIFNAKTQQLVERVPIEMLQPYVNSHEKIKVVDHFLINKSDALLATDHGLRQISIAPDGTIRIYNAPFQANKKLNAIGISCIEGNAQKELYIGAEGSFYKSDLSLTHCTIIDEFPALSESNWLKNINSLYIDEGNGIWLGCQFGLGFIDHYKSPFRRVYSDDGGNIRLDHVYSVYPVDSTSLFAATKNGLVFIDYEKNVFRYVKEGSPFYHVFKDRHGMFQASDNEGMHWIDNLELKPLNKLYPSYGPLSKTCITNNYINVNDSISALSTDNGQGVIIINEQKNLARQIDGNSKPVRLAGDIINTVYRDSKSRLWALSDKIITLISPGLRSTEMLQWFDSSTRQPLSIFFDMCEAKGYYWLAAYGTGIIQLDADFRIVKILSERDGLCNSGVYKVFNIGDSSLIITTNNGLSLYNIGLNRFVNYFEKDGLHSNSFEEACGVFINGKIYAGGVNGLTIIDPVHLRSNSRAPKLYFAGVRIELPDGTIDSNNLHFSRFVVPASWTQTNISFTGINYSNPDRVSFLYKLKEIDTAWINNDNRNLISLIGLSPGTYTLQVKAANEDGVVSDTIELTLEFLPKWYQTWWFKLSIVLAIAAIAYGFYRMRIIQLKKEESIRRRIAGDLHDDLGSTLNSIKVYTNLALMKPENTSYLHQMKEGVQSAITAVRDLVWVLDDKQDTTRHLVERAEQFIGPLTTANEIGFEKLIEPSVLELSLAKEEKRNLYLIIKEAVNNSIKYATPTIITLQIGLNQRNKFFVKISDNGNGFDPATVKKGNGLENITLRADQIRYELHIHSSTGKGASITLTKV